MRTLELTVITLALAAASACTGGADEIPDDYRAVLPDDRVLVNFPVAGGARDGHQAEAYIFTASVVGGVNGLISGVLNAIDTATDYPPTWHSEEDATAVWGPWPSDSGAAETALMVHHDAPTDVYTWVVAARPAGETDWDAFEGVVVGQVEAGATEDASEGWFLFDFDVAATYDDAVTARGQFANEYALDPDGAAANAAFQGFSDNGDPPVDAWYHYAQATAGSGLMDLAWLADVNPESGTGKVEGHLMRSRWQSDGAGRADALVGGGDLEDMGVVGAAAECWDTSFERSFYWNNWSPDATEGSAEACVFADAEYPEEQ